MSEKKESIKGKMLLVIIGACLGFGIDFFLDLKSFERTSKAYRFNDVVEKRFGMFEELSKMTGERLYITRKMLGAFQSNTNESKYKEAYDEVVRKWNIDTHRFYALIDNFYDVELRREYELKVNNPLVKVGNTIRYKKITSNFVSKQLDTISMNILGVDKMLLERLHENKNLTGKK